MTCNKFTYNWSTPDATIGKITTSIDTSIPLPSIVDRYKDNVLTLGALLDVLYPVGSIYTSMNNISPSQIFGGTWEPISGRFMYCTTLSESKQTGGSKKINVNQLPAHNHNFIGNEISGRVIVRPLSNGESLIVQDPNDAGALQVEESQHGAGKGAQFAGWGGTIKPSKDIAFRATPSGIISNTGFGGDYLPPYITIFAWYRVA